MTSHEPFAFSPETPCHRYLPEEAEALAKAWLHIFGQKRQGLNTKAFMWHIFSGGAYPALQQAAAQAAYLAQKSPQYCILSNSRTLAILTESQPLSCSLQDYYVFPPNMAWTMAFTHEDGWYGPYFAKHPDYKTLSRHNELAFAQKTQKEKEKAWARARGWLTEC